MDRDPKPRIYKDSLFIKKKEMKIKREETQIGISQEMETQMTVN